MGSSPAVAGSIGTGGSLVGSVISSAVDPAYVGGRTESLNASAEEGPRDVSMTHHHSRETDGRVEGELRKKY